MPQRIQHYEEHPVTSLSKTALGELPSIDRRVREIEELRSQFAGLELFCRHFTRTETKESDSRVTKPTLRSICERTREGESYLTDFIDYEAIGREVESLGIQDTPMKDAQSRALTHAVETAFEMGAEVYTELFRLNGDWNVNNKSTRKIERHYRARQRASIQASEKLTDMESQEQQLKLQASQTHNLDLPTTVKTRLLQTYAIELAELQNARQELILSSPEAFITYHTNNLRRMKHTFDKDGRIVETPFVQEKIARVLRIVGSGPVFIHGELGTGKTEFAKHVCTTHLARPYLERWYRDNPPPHDPTETDGSLDGKTHMRSLAWETQMSDWEKARVEAAQPYIIPGNKFIEPTDVTARLGIKIDKTLAPEEKVDLVRKQWEAFAASNSIAPEDAESWKTMFVDAYMHFLNSPVETVAFLGPLFEAMKEGKPLIIDEINAIPHHVLIGLNDLLLRKPGDIITPLLSEAEPFRVKQGFCVLATGNYRPEDNRVYIGRQPMDPAFLSRFGIVSYDYLPQNDSFETPGATAEELREFRTGNELYLMLIARMMESDLTLTAPAGDVDRLQALSVTAAKIQAIFSGKHDRTNQAWNAHTARGDIDPQDILKENVLSLRHLIRIVDLWQAEAFTLPLDYYLYTEYIERSTRPTEKEYLYRVLQITAGFFPVDEGWPSESSGKLSAFNLSSISFTPFVPTRMQRYGRSQLIEKLFGPLPKRQTILKERQVTNEVDKEIAARTSGLVGRIRRAAANSANAALTEFVEE